VWRRHHQGIHNTKAFIYKHNVLVLGITIMKRTHKHLTRNTLTHNGLYSFWSHMKYLDVCTHTWHLTFGTGVLHLIQINHQSDATVFMFIIQTFVYSSKCFGRFSAHNQELNDSNGSLWFYHRIVVTFVLCSWSGRPANCTMMHGLTLNFTFKF
jgi:hypothetical protein